MTGLVEVRCAAAPPPGGHYAQGVLHGGTLHVSGQLGLAYGMAPDTSVADQMAFALGNVERVARVVGAGRSHGRHAGVPRHEWAADMPGAGVLMNAVIV